MIRPYGELEREMIAKRVYVGECVASRSVGRPRKRWIDRVKAKRGLDIRQARRMGQVRSEWPGFLRGNAWSVTQGVNL